MDEQQKIETLLQSLETVCKLLNEETIKNATNEQLLNYLELTNKLKAIILSNL